MPLKLVVVSIALFAFGGSAYGQEFKRNDVAVGFGSTVSVDDRYPVSTGVPDLSIAYGLRISKFVQADVALDTAFHPVGKIFYRSIFDANDYLFVTQFGARAIIPAGSRLTFGVGGGPAIVHYSTAEDQAIGQIPFTRWGYYVLSSVKLSLDHAGRFYVGSTPRFIGTNGRSLGRFFILGGEFGYRF